MPVTGKKAAACPGIPATSRLFTITGYGISVCPMTVFMNVWKVLAMCAWLVLGILPLVSIEVVLPGRYMRPLLPKPRGLAVVSVAASVHCGGHALAAKPPASGGVCRARQVRP